MNYQSTQKFDSNACAGVQFELRKWSVARRREYNMAIAGPLSRLREIQDEQEALEEDLGSSIRRARISPCVCGHGPHEDQCQVAGCDCRKPDFPREKYRRIERLILETMRIRSEQIQPAVIKWGLVGVYGLEIDGSLATVDLLLDLGPDDLVQEIAGRLDEMLGLRGDSAKNSESPTTSGAPADGAMKSSGASNASEGSSTKSETA